MRISDWSSDVCSSDLQMLARMDIISVNCPHTPATFHLLSARRLDLLQPQAYIVNTARGEVIDENALVRKLRKGEIAGAGDRKSVVQGQSVSVRVDLGGRRIIKKKTQKTENKPI